MEKTVNTRLVIGPNASLTGMQALGFFAGLCVVCLGIAAGFAVRGYWPVIPFAGLELLAVGAALAVVLRRNRYRELLEFDGARLRVEIGLAGREASLRCEWPRSGTRVWLEPGPYPTSRSRLVMSCGAQRLTIGGCLTDLERERLARRLKELIHPAWVAAGTRAAAAATDRAGD